MSINAKQLIENVIRPSLKGIDLYSPASEQLVAGTFAVESAFGTYLFQNNDGPAQGLGQCEPVTYNYLKNNFLKGKSDLISKILYVTHYSVMPDSDRLVSDLALSVIFCRLKYLSINKPLPNLGDIQGQAAYWSKYYNCNPITGMPSRYTDAYSKYIGGYYAR